MADLVVDSHQHFWDIARFEYPWMGPEVAPIAKTIMPPDLAPTLAELGIDKTVLVQARSALEDTTWFLELATEYDFIAGVVGWVDLLDSNLPRVLDHLLGHPKFKGVRHQVHDEPDEAWIVRDDVLRGLRELAKRDIPYDLLLRPPHLKYVPCVVDRLPNLPLVVDHIAKPEIADGTIDEWARDMEQIAAIPHIYCKVSGMITEADWEAWTPAGPAPLWRGGGAAVRLRPLDVRERLAGVSAGRDLSAGLGLRTHDRRAVERRRARQSVRPQRRDLLQTGHRGVTRRREVYTLHPREDPERRSPAALVVYSELTRH